MTVWPEDDADFSAAEFSAEELRFLAGEGDLADLGTKRELAILLTPIAQAKALAAACALSGIAADAVDTHTGAVALLHDIDGEAPEQAASILSKVVSGFPIVLVTKTEGQIGVSQFLAGEEKGPLAPAVVLTAAPELVEDLIIGAVKPADVPGSVTSVGMGKAKALKLLADAARPHHFPRGHKSR